MNYCIMQKPWQLIYCHGKNHEIFDVDMFSKVLQFFYISFCIQLKTNISTLPFASENENKSIAIRLHVFWLMYIFYFSWAYIVRKMNLKWFWVYLWNNQMSLVSGIDLTRFFFFNLMLRFLHYWNFDETATSWNRNMYFSVLLNVSIDVYELSSCIISMSALLNVQKGKVYLQTEMLGQIHECRSLLKNGEK